MGIAEAINFHWYENVDPRTKNLPLVESPIIIPVILFSYLYFVSKCGPDFMKNRKPYNLLTFVKCYNLFQIVTNFYVVRTLISAGWFSDIPFTCIVPQYQTTPRDQKIILAIWLTFCLKLIDLIETGVFVLRKKDKQVSFLHLYHHVSTVILAWVVIKYACVEMSSFIVLVNSTVHVVMYSYYLLSTFGKEVQKALAPVKQLITIMQMAQFILLIVYGMQTLLPWCHVPKSYGILLIINLVINFILFYNFYRKNYNKPNRKES